MKTKLILSPYRLVTKLLVLAFMLTALAFAPAPQTVSASGCVLECNAWSQRCGCWRTSYCCVDNNGTYWCSYSTNPDCNGNALEEANNTD
jgi:hypothetical protein